MKRIALFLLIGISFVGLSLTTADPAEETEKIDWLTFEEALEKNEKEPKKWIIDVYTSWCGWCKRMDATTFKDPNVIEAINRDYYAVKLDGEYKKDIEVKGRTYKFVAKGRRGYHQLPAELMGGKMSYPTMVYLDEKLGIIQAIGGYLPAKDIHPILKFIGNDDYKHIKWEEYKSKKYKSPYVAEPNKIEEKPVGSNH